MPTRRSKSFDKTSPHRSKSKEPQTSKSDPSTSKTRKPRERARSVSRVKTPKKIEQKSKRSPHNSPSKHSTASSNRSDRSDGSRKNIRYYAMTGEAAPLPWFSSAHPEMSKTDKHCLQFIAELWAFLQEASERGVVRGVIHPDLQRFLNEYAPSLRYTVKLCADRLTRNEKLWETMKKNDTLVFPDGLADMLNLCLERLTTRLRGMKRARNDVETTYDEVFAAPLLAILELVTSPQHADRDIRLSKLVITRCYTWMVAYLKALPHKCTGRECKCMENAGPIETALETAVLPGAAKYCADTTFLKPIFYAELKSMYKPLISFNWVLALSVLLMKGGHEREVEAYLPKIISDLGILSDNGSDCVNSVLMIRTDVGQYTAQGQCSDFVLVALDMIVKKLASISPRLFTLAHMDVIEGFYVNQRPMSAMIVFQILCIFKDKRPDLMSGRKKKYLATAEDMNLDESHMKLVRSFPD